MALLNGVVNSLSTTALSTNANLLPSQFARARFLFPTPGQIPTTAITDLVISSPYKNVARASGLQKSAAAWMGDAYSDDFYHRVHFIPKSVDLGVFSTNTGVQVVLWNAFLENKDLTLIEGVDVVGLGLTGTLPTETLRSHSVYYYDIDANADEGPNSVDGRFLFTIGGVIYTLVVTGERAVFFPFLPNWSTAGVGESLAWNTSFFRSESGKISNAKSFTQNPGQSFTWDSLLEEKQYQEFENVMWNAQWRDFLIAVPSDVGWASLSAPVAVNDGVLSVSGDEYLSFMDGGLVAIYSDYNSFEVAQIDTYSSGQMVLLRPIKQSWPAGTEIFPVTSAHIGNNQSVAAHNDSVVALTFNWQCDPVDNTPFLPEQLAPLTYNGYELYLAEPNRVRPGSIGFEADYSAFTQPNAVFRDQHQDHSTISRSYEWVLAGREAIYNFRAFLGRRSGFKNPCYLPLWQSAFLLLEEVFAAGTQIIVEDNKFSQFVGVHPARAHILMLLTDGEFLPLEITDVTKNLDGTILLDLASSVGRDIAPTDVVRIYNLPLMRMNELVSMSWASSGALTTTINFSSENP